MSEQVVSILKEQKPGERRVILVPRDVAKFAESGLAVLVEQDAGLASGHFDEAYRDAGAEIVDTETAWNSARVIFKYKAPGPDEYRHFRPDMHLASFMHAEGNLDLVEAMRASGMTAYALEFFRFENGTFPVPVSDNEISGKLAVILAAYHLQSSMGGSGTLLASVSGAPPAKVVVIGYGNVGGAAARLSAAMGANVKVFGTDPHGLRQFSATVPPNIECRQNTPADLESAILEADVVIGAILISTHDTPPMVPDSLVKRMKPGSVLVDVTCGYGEGYMPSFDRQTLHKEPFFEKYGVLHCKIDAMPASVALTATEATSANVWRHLLDAATGIFRADGNPTADAGCLVTGGKVVHPELLRHIAFAESA